MDLTLGEPHAFTEGTIREVLRRAEANVRADLELALADETERRGRLEGDLAALGRRSDVATGAEPCEPRSNANEQPSPPETSRTT